MIANLSFDRAQLALLTVPNGYISQGRHVKAESFFARDNVAQFINWCRSELGISDTIMFETEDLVLRKNEKNFILTLLEVRLANIFECIAIERIEIGT